MSYTEPRWTIPAAKVTARDEATRIALVDRLKRHGVDNLMSIVAPNSDRPPDAEWIAFFHQGGTNGHARRVLEKTARIRNVRQRPECGGSIVFFDVDP